MKLKSTDTSPAEDLNLIKSKKQTMPHVMSKPFPDNDKFARYGNKATYDLADAIRNDPALNDLCRCLYEDGYKSAGAMLCKLREYGPKWQSAYTGLNAIHLKDDTVKCSEITPLLDRLFKPTKTNKTK